MERKNDALGDIHKLPFGLRVRALRLAAGLSQNDLAEKLETTKATISKIENSAIQPSPVWAERLAKQLGADPSDLLFGAPTSSANVMMFGSTSASSSSRSTSVTMVPIIGMIAAGNWREAIQTPEGHIAVAGASPHMFALRVFGDSIDKIAPDGSYVTIDPTMPGLHDGYLYAVQNGDGDATVKRFRKNPDRLEPESTNPEHKTIELGREPITIVGRATSVTRPL
jgi:repressor LexA